MNLLTLPLVLLLLINVGFQAYNFMLQMTEPFYYHRVTTLTPTVERMGRHFVRLLEGAVNEPNRDVAELSLLDAAERRHLVSDLGAAPSRYTTEHCLHDLVARH